MCLTFTYFHVIWPKQPIINTGLISLFVGGRYSRYQKWRCLGFPYVPNKGGDSAVDRGCTPSTTYKLPHLSWKSSACCLSLPTFSSSVHLFFLLAMSSCNKCESAQSVFETTLDTVAVKCLHTLKNMFTTTVFSSSDFYSCINQFSWL